MQKPRWNPTPLDPRRRTQALTQGKLLILSLPTVPGGPRLDVHHRGGFMDTNVLPAVRHVDRIISKVNHGATAQSEDQNIVIAPDSFRLTDPFLIMGEEWFSSPGFD